MAELGGKRALVTGASAGIGAATALALARAGAEVLLAARRLDRLQSLAEAIRGEGGQATPLELDVRDGAAVEQALAGRQLDVVVANAGMARGVEPLFDGDAGDWAEMLDTNVLGLAHVARHGLPPMLERGAGDFVLLGSVAGRQVYPGGSMYCASKHAVRALYESLRIDAAGRGVRFTTVDPGMVETEFSLVRFRGDREQAARTYSGFTPLRPEDVADAVLYAVTRPPHVNVGELVLWPTDQASTTLVRRTTE